MGKYHVIVTESQRCDSSHGIVISWSHHNGVTSHSCCESPRKERVSHTFEHLISNIKLHNRDINSMVT